MVVEHTKTNRDRFVFVVPKVYDILQKIERQGEYIFMRDGNRITSIRIATILRKFARYEGMPLQVTKCGKPLQAIKCKRCPFRLYKGDVGHSNLSTALGYIYNPLTEKQTYELITKAL